MAAEREIDATGKESISRIVLEPVLHHLLFFPA
jgi:hypothetical protein